MISPHTINISDLPSLPLEQKKSLPKYGGIYFVINSDDEILYIGRSSNLRSRWQNHHRHHQFEKNTSRIAWLEVSDTSLLADIESALISWFHPQLNFGLIPEQEAKRGITIVYTRYKYYPGIGERIKSYRKQSEKTFTELAADAGISVPHWHRIEKEQVKELPIETLRRIEKSLNVDLGVSFDD